MYNNSVRKQADIAIIGGSGFYDLSENLVEVKIDTPFGPPSDKIAIGSVSGKKVAFLPRHNKSHNIPPHLINYRANIWALKSLGVKEIIATTACGSLQKRIKRGDFVIIDQFIDRTSGRADSYYQGPLVTHISAAYPYCPRLSKFVYKIAKKMNFPIHKKGTSVVINGPRFSSCAESKWFSKMGWDIVNMTQYPEVILARELEICYCAIALVTDYDAGVAGGTKIKPVTVEEVVKNFNSNITKAKKLLVKMLRQWPDKSNDCECRSALKSARLE